MKIHTEEKEGYPVELDIDFFMKKKPRYYWAIILSVFLCKLSFAELVTIYLIPFDVETYSPVDKHNIDCMSFNVWQFFDDETIGKSIQSLRKSEETFDSKRIRGAIYIDNKKYFIDKEKNITVNGSTRTVSDSFMSLLRTKMKNRYRKSKPIKCHSRF